MRSGSQMDTFYSHIEVSFAKVLQLHKRLICARWQPSRNAHFISIMLIMSRSYGVLHYEWSFVTKPLSPMIDKFLLFIWIQLALGPTECNSSLSGKRQRKSATYQTV